VAVREISCVYQQLLVETGIMGVEPGKSYQRLERKRVILFCSAISSIFSINMQEMGDTWIPGVGAVRIITCAYPRLLVATEIMEAELGRFYRQLESGKEILFHPKRISICSINMQEMGDTWTPEVVAVREISCVCQRVLAVIEIMAVGPGDSLSKRYLPSNEMGRLYGSPSTLNY
jgi:hypothetical protein